MVRTWIATVKRKETQKARKDVLRRARRRERVLTAARHGSITITVTTAITITAGAHVVTAETRWLAAVAVAVAVAVMAAAL
jgi:hypothetical protein